MQTQFKLSATEVNDAVGQYVAKAQRNKNLKVTGVVAGEDGTVIVSADVEIKAPVKRAPRKAKDILEAPAQIKHTKKA
jgi:hypothetical protein